jgi:uncharacterized protein
MHKVWRLVRISLGIFFILLGLPGLLLPVLLGGLFFVMGAVLLSVDFLFFKHMVDWLEKRFPKIRAPLQRFRKFLKGRGEGEL